jgi:hypothetical protein
MADFNNLSTAITSPSVVNGDTIYVESSNLDYSAGGLNKRLVFIGTGYFHDPANTSFPPNTGLQAALYAANIGGINFNDGSSGSKLIGLSTSSISIIAGATPINLTIERCFIASGIFFNNATHSGITIRKNFFSNGRIEGSNGSLTNFICENNIFYTTFSYVSLSILTGSSNVFRNNSFFQVGVPPTIPNCYIANNIFDAPSNGTFTNSTIKNNIFSGAQVLPGTATNNQLNVVMANVYVSGTTGSIDSRIQLKPGSPAIGAGLTVGAVVNPDCGAYGATDPYKLSGIPQIPSIYGFTVPVSIPSGSATMNVTFSTRNNN